MSNQASVDNTLDYPGEETPVAVPERPANIRDFVNLTKPGILFSNSITAFGGFWLASHWDPNWLNLLLTLVGTALVMASGCVLNNYLDRDMDTKMERTRKRALPTGIIKPNVVLWYGISLGVAGVAVLASVSMLAALLGLIGLFVYVWIYTAWLKRTSVWSTTGGAISGAIPPMIGYCAVTNTVDWAAMILFGILFLWQPPHFWALGIRRKEEYRAAGFPLLPVVHGNYVTKISMMRYLIPLVPVSTLLFFTGQVGVFYLFAAPILSLIWLFMGVRGFKAKDEDKWAKGMFIYSINYIMFLFLIVVIDTVS